MPRRIETLVNRNDQPLLCCAAAALRFLYRETGKRTSSSIHVQNETAHAIHETEITVAHRHNIPFLLLRSVGSGLHDGVSVRKRAAGIIHHVSGISRAGIEA